MDKSPISAQEFQIASIKLGIKIYQAGLRPNLLIGLWRGGTPVAIAVHEYFMYMGHEMDHYPVRVISYTGIAERADKVYVDGLEYLDSNKERYKQILIVDDVFDTGNSFQTITHLIRNISPEFDIKIAAPWYKPANNQTTIAPDFFIFESDQWLIFPHELEGLTNAELQQYKPEVYELIKNAC